jgi:hypothetical protein
MGARCFSSAGCGKRHHPPIVCGSIRFQRAELQKMKQPITIDPELLATARICAKEENRTLTNFLETQRHQAAT